MAQGKIFLFTGKNTEELLCEKRRWATEFTARCGDADFLLLRAQGLTVPELTDAVTTAPFLAQHRLVMVEGIPRFDADQMKRCAEAVHEKCILVFLEAAPDGRLAGVKALQKLATVKTFEPRTGADLKVFLQKELAARGKIMAPAALALLVELVGEDQAILVQELEKLSLFSGERPIFEEDVRLLVVPAGEREVWEFSRLLASGNARMALGHVQELLARGEDGHALWNIVLWVLRQYVSVWAAVQEGSTNPADIAKRFSVPFPSVKTFLPVCKRVDRAHMEALLRSASEYDIGLKTGVYRATTEAPEEVLSLLDLLLVRMAELVAPAR